MLAPNVNHPASLSPHTRIPLNAVLFTLTLCTTLYPAASAQQPGFLRTDISPAGHIAINLGGADHASALAVQPDGKLLVLGPGGPNAELILARFNPDGSPDRGFANFGQLVLPETSCSHAAPLIRPDGRILIASDLATFANNTWHTRLLLLQLNPDGTPDPTFGAAGRVELATTDAALPLQLAARPDNHVLLAATISESPAFLRFNPDGTLDPTFDHDGWLAPEPPAVTHFALEPSGAFIAAGTQTTPNPALIARRFHPDGSPDTAYANNGRFTYPVSPAELNAPNTGPAAVLPRGDGSVIIAANLATEALFLQLTPAGILDPTFATAGVAHLASPDARPIVHRLVRDPFTRYLLAGWFDNPSQNLQAPLLARFNPDGSLDTTFGHAGLAPLAFDTPSETFAAAALTPDAHLALAGRLGDPATQDLDWLLAKVHLYDYPTPRTSTFTAQAAQAEVIGPDTHLAPAPWEVLTLEQAIPTQPDYRGVLEFDLTRLPTDATLQAATLNLDISTCSGGGSPFTYPSLELFPYPADGHFTAVDAATLDTPLITTPRVSRLGLRPFDLGPDLAFIQQAAATADHLGLILRSTPQNLQIAFFTEVAAAAYDAYHRPTLEITYEPAHDLDGLNGIAASDAYFLMHALTGPEIPPLPPHEATDLDRDDDTDLADLATLQVALQE